MFRINVILNPYAGRGRGVKNQAKISRLFNQADVDLTLTETKDIGHGIELARAAVMAGYDLVVAAGGDGTINEVVNGLVQAARESQIAGRLAILPLGTGNDFADMLQIPRNLDQSVPRIISALAENRTRFVDIGIVQITTEHDSYTRYFNNNVGIGLEAQVTLESYKIKRLRGSLLYIVAALRTLKKYNPPHMDVKWTDHTDLYQRLTQPLTLISIGNSARTGGGFYLTPDAQFDDGWLDIAIADVLSTWQALMLLPKALRGKHIHDPAVTMSRCRDLQLASHNVFPIHVDGEVITSDARQVEIELLPQQLGIVT